MATVWRAAPEGRRPQDRWRRATKTLSCYSRDLASRTGTLDGSPSNPPCRRNRFRAERQAARFYPAALFGSPLGLWLDSDLMAGNHGDEYEGQVALGKLIRSLEPAEVSGRIIILPSANFPAAMAGMRTSPLDEGNLNRSFPGDPYGGPTAQIADYISARPAMTMANGHFKPVNLVANRPA